MMEAEDRKTLEQLQAQVQCTKGFQCTYATLDTLCAGHYHPDTDILECLDKSEPACSMARPFGCTSVCTCPARRFIAKNIDRWSAGSTGRLRAAQDAPAT